MSESKQMQAAQEAQQTVRKVQEVIEVVGETFLQGCFSGQHYTRARYRCPGCKKFAVAVEGGSGDVLPESVPTICETCHTALSVRGWRKTDG